MVNYNRMEDVPRAYGPLEPIGPTRLERRSGLHAPPPGRRKSYAARNFAVGAAAVVFAGGAMGLYFRPDFGEEPARGGPADAPAEPASAEGVDIMVAEGPPPATVAPPAPVEAVPIDVSYAEIADAALGATGSAPVAAAPLPRAPEPVQQSGPFAAARRAFDRVMPQRAAPEPRRLASAAPARSVGVMRDSAAPAIARPAPAPAPVPRRAEPIVIARADPPRAVAVSEPEPVRPAFDCSRAAGAGARTVCQNPDLAALDRRLATEFERAVAAGHDRAALSLDQDAWLARREAAAPDPRAVAEAYQRRIRELRSMQ